MRKNERWTPFSSRPRSLGGLKPPLSQTGTQINTQRKPHGVHQPPDLPAAVKLTESQGGLCEFHRALKPGTINRATLIKSRPFVCNGTSLSKRRNPSQKEEIRAFPSSRLVKSSLLCSTHFVAVTQKNDGRLAGKRVHDLGLVMSSAVNHDGAMRRCRLNL